MRVLRTGPTLLVLFFLVSVQEGASGQAKPKVPDHPIKIFTWGGAGTGFDLWDHQWKMMTHPRDTEDADWYPDATSIEKMRNADIVYIQNHGGVVTEQRVYHLFLHGKDHFLERDLGFPSDEDRGPRLILAWGCQNGNSAFKRKDGTVKDLKSAYAKGMGVLAGSKTKVFIGPKWDVGVWSDTFQEEFFKAFGEGNVTAEKAARTAFARLQKNVGKYSQLSTSTFESCIGIQGNGQLTLNEIRENLIARKKKAAATAPPETPAKTPSPPGKPKVSARPPHAREAIVHPLPPLRPPEPRAPSLGRIFANQGGMLIRSNIVPSELSAGNVITLAKNFVQQPVDRPPQPPATRGPIRVSGGGKLEGHVVGTPHVPNQWSLFNTNSSLAVYYEPLLGSEYGPSQTILSLAGQFEDNDLKGTAEWSGPGRLTFFLWAPMGGGPLTMGSFDQAGKATITPLELRPEIPNCAGYELHDGDQIQAGAGATFVRLPSGAILTVRPSSRVRLTAPRPGIVRIELLGDKGSCRVRGFLPGQREGIEVKVREKITRLTGTDVLFTLDGAAGSVAVLEGAVEVTGGAESVSLDAGARLDLATSEVGEAAPVPPEVVNGLLAHEVLTERSPKAPGLTVAEFPGGDLDAGWRWEDPGSDCTRRSPGPGVLEITVPDGNDLWGGRGTAPRLLHKVTGDFNLQARLDLSCKGRDLAIVDFLLFSPGSYLGVLAKQMDDTGVLAHYRLLGGGILQHQSMRKFPALGRNIYESPDAPEGPVWVRLSRRGHWWKAFRSEDGEQWRLVARERFLAPETLHVGWSIKRIANDRLRDEPAVVRLEAVELYSDVAGQLADLAWEADAPEGGSVRVDGDRVTLALDGTRHASITAHLGRPLPDEPPKPYLGVVRTARGQYSDFDATIRFETEGWDHQPGQYRHFSLQATTGDGKNHVYVGLQRRDGHPPQYHTDLQIEGQWGRHKDIRADRTDLGFLRITRSRGQFTTYVWQDGWWIPLAAFGAGFDGPVFLVLSMNNAFQSRVPAALTVAATREKFLVGRIGRGDEVWRPERGAVLSAAQVPRGVTFPDGTQGVLQRSPFPLGRLFFGAKGEGFVFSSQKEKDLLLRIHPDGLTTLAYRGKLAAGVNLRSGAVASGGELLITVDFWPGGGNRLSGLHRLTPDGEFRPWKLSRDYGGMCDIVPAPGGGWYFSDLESYDNVYHIVRESADERPLIVESSRLHGPAWLAVGADGLVHVVNLAGGYAQQGNPGLFRITPDGETELLLQPPQGSNFGGLAASTGELFGSCMLVSLPTEGQVVRVRPDGSAEPLITGLVNPSAIAVNPKTGELWIVTGEEGKDLLWVRNDTGPTEER